MKSGLSQNEKLAALRIVIDNVNENTLNSKLSEIAHIEKQINFFEQSGLETSWDVRMPPKRHRFNDYHTDHLQGLRWSVCYTGHIKPIRKTEFKLKYLILELKHWQEGDSVLCLTDDDINKHSGCFYFEAVDAPGAHPDAYWVYQGRDHIGYYSFKYTSDYYRCSLSGLGDGEYFKRMCPAEAMKLERRDFYCRQCWDQHFGQGCDSDGVIKCDCAQSCDDCNEYYCVCP